jgi:hypothetical protein
MERLADLGVVGMLRLDRRPAAQQHCPVMNDFVSHISVPD